MSRDWKLFLEDIIESCEKIMRYVDQETQEQFMADERTFDAVIRNLEIIGEAAKNVPETIRQCGHEIEWRKAAGAKQRACATCLPMPILESTKTSYGM